jgi:hypothetical protein
VTELINPTVVEVALPADAFPCVFAGQKSYCETDARYWIQAHPAPRPHCEEALMCGPCLAHEVMNFRRNLRASEVGLVACTSCNGSFAAWDEIVRVVTL